MYDPTIFENLKVAIENYVYDLDNLDHKINITNRTDRMDFAVIDREFTIQFHLVNNQDVTAEIVLSTTLDDLAGEILEIQGKNLGCFLSLRFYKRVKNVPTQCQMIEQALKEIWKDEIQLTQTLSFFFEVETSDYLDMIEVKFLHKIHEDHMGEIADFLEHVLETLEVLYGI